MTTVDSRAPDVQEGVPAVLGRAVLLAAGDLVPDRADPWADTFRAFQERDLRERGSLRSVFIDPESGTFDSLAYEAEARKRRVTGKTKTPFGEAVKVDGLDLVLRDSTERRNWMMDVPNAFLLDVPDHPEVFQPLILDRSEAKSVIDTLAAMARRASEKANLLGPQKGQAEAVQLTHVVLRLYVGIDGRLEMRYRLRRERSHRSSAQWQAAWHDFADWAPVVNLLAEAGDLSMHERLEAAMIADEIASLVPLTVRHGVTLEDVVSGEVRFQRDGTVVRGPRAIDTLFPGLADKIEAMKAAWVEDGGDGEFL